MTNSTPAAAAGPAPLWREQQMRAWRPPERITLPAWSEKYRYLTRRQSDTPGPWRNANNPAVVGFMVVMEKPGVRQLSAKKHSQGGWSESVRNFIGKQAHLEPDPLLLVLPDKEKGRTIVQKRIIPLFQDTPVLRQLSTGRRWDQKNNQITLLNGFTLQLGYSGSISSVSSDPARWVVCDERSKFQDDGRVSIADSIRARTSRYANSLIINLSTPGPEPDPISQLFDAASVKLFYFVTCPHCVREQRLSFDGLRWTPHRDEEPDKVRRAERIRLERSAWMECENPACRGRMECRDQPAIVRAGFWATEDFAWRCYADGREAGEFPRGTTVGMHAPRFISLAPGHRWSEIAAMWAEAEGDHTKTVGFYNEVLAEVYQPSTKRAVASVFQAKCRPDPETGFTPPKAKVLPRWVARLVMGVDTQKDHFYFVIRGYGHGGRSVRVHHGKAFGFEDLSSLADESFWPYEGNELPALRVYKTGIDSGGGKMGLDASRTDAVYRWCLADSVRRIPLKGDSESNADLPLRWSQVTYAPPDQRRTPYQVRLLRVNVHHYQDLLASDIDARVTVTDPATGEVTGEQDLWLLNDIDDEEYNRHLANMKRALVRSRGRRVERWIKNSEGARVDYRAVEGYLRAMADGPAECASLPTFEQMRAMRLAPKAPPASGGVRMPDGRKFGVWQR